MRACSVGKSVGVGCGLGAGAGETAGGGFGCSTVLPSCLAGGGKNLALLGTVTESLPVTGDSTVTESVPVAGDLSQSGGVCLRAIKTVKTFQQLIHDIDHRRLLEMPRRVMLLSAGMNKLRRCRGWLSENRWWRNLKLGRSDGCCRLRRRCDVVSVH